MSKRFWVRASLCQAVKRLFVIPFQRVKDALQTDDEWFFRQELDGLVQKDGLGTKRSPFRYWLPEQAARLEASS